METLHKRHTFKFLENSPFLDQLEDATINGKFILTSQNDSEPLS